MTDKLRVSNPAYNNCLNAMFSYYDMAGHPNWHGDNEKEITKEVFETAVRSVLNMQTYGLPAPDPAPTGDGGFLLTWTFEPNIEKAEKAFCEFFPECTTYMIIGPENSPGGDVKTFDNEMKFYKEVARINKNII